MNIKFVKVHMRVLIAFIWWTIPVAFAAGKNATLEEVKRQIAEIRSQTDLENYEIYLIGKKYAQLDDVEVLQYLFDRGGQTASAIVGTFSELRDPDRRNMLLLVILEGSDIGWWDDPPGNMKPGSKFRDATAFWIVDDVRKHFPDRTITKADLCVKATRRAYGAELRAKLGLPPLAAQEAQNPTVSQPAPPAPTTDPGRHSAPQQKKEAPEATNWWVLVKVPLLLAAGLLALAFSVHRLILKSRED